jgi:hypothetical protein
VTVESTPAKAAPGLVDNRPPTIQSVVFGSDSVSAASDLRLRISASDPDGEIIRVRTRWAIDGMIVKTETPVLPRSHLRRGASIRAAVVATDGTGKSAPFVTHEIIVANAPPRFTTFPSGFDPAGSFLYFLQARDPDLGDDLEFRLLQGPRGMQIEPDAEVLEWHPRFHQSGRHPVRVEVRDRHGGVDVQAFELVVDPAAARDLGELGSGS